MKPWQTKIKSAAAMAAMAAMAASLCVVAVLLPACAGLPGNTPSNAPTSITPDIEARIAAISQRYVFADMHAHPSRFHRANVPHVSAEEVALYQRAKMDMAVANVSADAPYSGRYLLRDGTEIPRGQYRPEPGSVFDFARERLSRLQETFDLGIAVHAADPDAVLAAKSAGRFAILPALEGADALEGKLENLQRFYEQGLRLLQLVHFRPNELGHIQTWPYAPGGLTRFGEQVVREANRMGIVIDLAHCNTETIMDVLAISKQPVLFSHGGLQALLEQDRALSDEEMAAIAAGGGVIGIWPHGRYIESIERMVDYIEHAISVAGPDHVGIGSDLRGVSRYTAGFGRAAEFRAIAQELLRRGHDDDTVGKVMGGNFFRVWSAVSEGSVR